MKLFKYSGVFLGLICALLFCAQFSQNRTQFAFRSYDPYIEDMNKFDAYNARYEELSWLKGDEPIYGSVCYNKQPNASSNIYLSLKFLDAIISGEYLDYLDLFLEEEASLRLTFSEFLDFHGKLKKMVSQSIFSEEEFKDILFYGLILGEVKNSDEFKEKAWVYGTASLSEILVMYQDILPTLKRFSDDQKKVLRLVLEGFHFEGLLEKYRNNIDYQVGNSCPSIENFDISFLMFICHMAGKYSNAEHSKTRFTSGYFSYLTEFGNDLVTHLQPSF